MGVVRRAVHKKTKQQVVVKGTQISIAYQREYDALLALQGHPNIVKLIGISKGELSWFIVTEFVEAGDLGKLLSDPKIDLNWELIFLMVLDICNGMTFYFFGVLFILTYFNILF